MYDLHSADNATGGPRGLACLFTAAANLFLEISRQQPDEAGYGKPFPLG